MIESTSLATTELYLQLREAISFFASSFNLISNGSLLYNPKSSYPLKNLCEYFISTSPKRPIIFGVHPRFLSFGFISLMCLGFSAILF